MLQRQVRITNLDTHFGRGYLLSISPRFNDGSSSEVDEVAKLSIEKTVESLEIEMKRFM